jgi:hypothetical protein
MITFLYPREPIRLSGQEREMIKAKPRCFASMAFTHRMSAATTCDQLNHRDRCLL